jgi:hypothetical protein
MMSLFIQKVFKNDIKKRTLWKPFGDQGQYFGGERDHHFVNSVLGGAGRMLGSAGRERPGEMISTKTSF